MGFVFNEKLARDLYNMRMSDVKIAEKCFVSKGVIWRWRKANNLPSSRSREFKPIADPEKVAKKSLADFVKEADAAGMSYGRYMSERRW